MPSYSNQVANVPESFESQIKPTVTAAVQDSASEVFSFWEFLEQHPHPEEEVKEGIEKRADGRVEGAGRGDETDTN
jgi:hypothetical protein